MQVNVPLSRFKESPTPLQLKIQELYNLAKEGDLVAKSILMERFKIKVYTNEELSLINKMTRIGISLKEALDKINS